MCELLAVTSDAPFALGRLWPMTDALERYGIAGFGWGVAWRTQEGTFGLHVSTGAFQDDSQRDELGRLRTKSALIHLRRPSRLSTIGLPDTQPFLDPDGRFAFGHNGDLAGYRIRRPGYLAQGRIRGRADSEVGQRWMEDHWGSAPPAEACSLLGRLHDEMGGQANLMAMAADGSIHAWAGNTENPMFDFRLDDLRVVSTGIHSLDRSLFRLCAPGATRRRLLRPGDALHPSSLGAADAGG